MHIVWFRRDLRLSDNEIVALAVANNAPVLPCFIIDSWFYQQPDVGKAWVKFLFESLENLNSNLLALGSQLYIFEGESVATLSALTSELRKQSLTPKLFFNRDVQVKYGIERDRQIVDFYRQHNLDYHLGLNNFVQVNGDCRDQWFDEYYTYQRQPLHPTPTKINTPQLALNLPQLTIAQLKQKYSQFYSVDNNYFTGGETAAIATLESFLKHRFTGYHWKVSRPMLAQQGATSHLSPHLTFGTISTRTVYQSTKARAKELASQPKAELSLKAFRDRLRWRDSFTQRLYHHPELVHQNHYPEFDEHYNLSPLTEQKQELFTAWKEGETGFPLVDASMRQLKTMGWMNFRTRAMCATFLCINCGVSWHHGGEHYMQHLVDGDLAIDHWQWQMQAGITNPLSDTFRIYNPNKNIEDRDKDLQFIYHWVPELHGYSLPEILNGVYLGESPYPAPVLDWAQTRKINGLIVSNLRKKVKQRLIESVSDELQTARKVKTTVDKYFQAQAKQYQKYQHQQQNHQI